MRKTFQMEELLGKSKAELIRILLEQQEIQIPVSIFSRDESPLEALVLYSVDTLGLSVSEIAKRLSRNKQTIWTTYYKVKNKTKKKNKKIILGKQSQQLTVPFSLFSKDKTSVLESLCFYMKNFHSMKYVTIASIINKDVRTVWTCVKRFEKKTVHKKLFLEEEK